MKEWCQSTQLENQVEVLAHEISDKRQELIRLRRLRSTRLTI
jgi:hypothetical protein